MKLSTIACVALTAVLLLPGCGKKKPPATAADVSGQLAEKPAVEPTQHAEADGAFDKRHTREGTEEAIALYEEALAAEPDRPDGKAMRVRLAVLYYGLAYYFDRTESKKHKMAIYLLGKDHAFEAVMRTNPEFKAAIDDGERVQDAIRFLVANDVDAAYWCALNWARWGEQKGILRVAMDIPKVRGFNEKILELGEDYYYGAVHRFFGAFFVEIPQFAGQDFDRARMHFERGVELAPDWTENQVNYAWYYARRRGDREMYERLLREVIETPIPEDSVFRFEYEVARFDAQEMLAQADDIF